MTYSNWNKVEFQDFINRYNKKPIIENAPTLLYSKKDKEHEAFGSLVAFFFVTGGLLIYISLSFLLMSLFFSLFVFITIIVIASITNVILLIIYFRSHVPIKPLECWIEIYEGIQEEDYKYYCFTYYPVFSGKCLPNKGKNVLYKILQDELFHSKLDITQIEVYLKFQVNNPIKYEIIGYFFQYGEGLPFKNENIDRNSWKFFPFQKNQNENYLAIANWDHQYEFRNDLELDYDKLHHYAPWIIQKWDENSLKPLTQHYKNELMWDLRPIESQPKLNPWEMNFQSKSFESFKAFKDLQLMNDAIQKVIGLDVKIEKLKDIKNYILEFKAYLRDLKGQ